MRSFSVLSAVACVIGLVAAGPSQGSSPNALATRFNSLLAIREEDYVIVCVSLLTLYCLGSLFEIHANSLQCSSDDECDCSEYNASYTASCNFEYDPPACFCKVDHFSSPPHLFRA